VATQWLSVPGLDPHVARALSLPDVRVLAAVRHGHKLRTGHLRANRFVITLHGVDDAITERARTRLDALVRRGMPNRFGTQRFGRDGDNAAAGARALRGEARPRDRRKLRFLVSALQAAVFNAALAARERPAHEVEAGDVAVVHASGGLFLVEDPAREAPRAEAFEISPTGPIFGTEVGRKIPSPVGAPARREARALREHGIDPETPLRPPRGLRVPGGRRALRVRPGAAGLAREGDTLRLGFELPPGSYATVLLEELVGAGPTPR
jgi:tRNA pseudouridine13 synthase